MNAKEQVIQMQPDAKVAIWKTKYRIVRDRLPNESVIFMAVPITGLYGTGERQNAPCLELIASIQKVIQFGTPQIFFTL